MMEQRWQILREILMEETGISYCYYDPPATIRMYYPCIIFHLSDQDSKYADNMAYLRNLRWDVTVVDPVSTNGEIYVGELTSLPHCRFGRHYVADNLHHYTFSIYY